MTKFNAHAYVTAVVDGLVDNDEHLDFFPIINHNDFSFPEIGVNMEVFEITLHHDPRLQEIHIRAKAKLDQIPLREAFNKLIKRIIDNPDKLFYSNGYGMQDCLRIPDYDADDDEIVEAIENEYGEEGADLTFTRDIVSTKFNDDNSFELTLRYNYNITTHK